MRVCLVTIHGHGIGGMQDHTRDLARGLAAVGHEVDVITTRDPDAPTTREREVDGATWHLVDAPARYERFPFHHHEWLRQSYELFRRLHAQRPYDVVQSESTSALELMRRRADRLVPVVIKYQGNFIGLTRAGWRRAVEGDARARVREAKALVWRCGLHLQRWECFRFRDCEWMVPTLQQFDDTRRGEFLHRDRGHVVPNGIDADTFRPRDADEVRRALGLDGPGPFLVGAGRLNYEKGFDVAIRALAQLRGDLPTAQLVIVGDGEEAQPLRELAASLGLDGSVVFAGGHAKPEVARYMAAADVFLFPTMRDEAAGMVLMQAMACGVPVVASAVGGITEEAEDAAVLAPPGDDRALADAVRGLVADAGERERLARAGRERVLAGYTVERMVELTVDVYETAIARRA
jgi:glycosyltransferase involved in cell wall biosynthesis